MQHMTSLTIFFMLFFYYAVPTALLSILQYFLSRLESPWPGRVLPILSAVNSLCWTLGILTMFLFNLVAPGPDDVGTLFLLILPALISLIIFNIPTLIFLLVYKNTRRRFTERRAMDRKDIQDL